MIHKIFRSILFFSFLSTCFPAGLIANTNVSEEQIKQVLCDEFIKKFAEKINNDRVIYDGKTLTLHVDPSTKWILFRTALAIVSGFYGCLVGVSGIIEDRIILERIFYCVICSALCGISFSLFENVMHDITKRVPFIKMNEKEIEICNKNKILWSDIDSFNTSEWVRYSPLFDTETVLSKRFELLDKYLNTVLTVKKNGNLPISIDNFKAIVQYYLDQSRAEQQPTQ